MLGNKAPASHASYKKLEKIGAGTYGKVRWYCN